MTEKKTYALSVLNKADYSNINAWVYQTLRRSIMCGEIPPGVALTIRGLAEKLDVSAMPIREALQKLASEAAVEMNDTRRVTVPIISPEKFSELCSLRILLETHAAQAALPYFTSENIKKLRSLDKTIDKAYADSDIEGGSLANQAFHRFIYQRNPIQVSLPLIESVWLQLGPFTRVALGRLEKYYDYDRHQEAIEAIVQKDAFALRRAIEADIRDSVSIHQNIDEIYQDLRSKD